MLGWIRAIRIKKGQQIAGSVGKSCFECAAVAPILLVANQAHIGIRADDLDGAIFAAVVDHDHFRPADARCFQRGANTEHTIEDIGNPIFFIVGGDNDG